jgi:hypothetical protein
MVQKVLLALSVVKRAGSSVLADVQTSFLLSVNTANYTICALLPRHSGLLALGFWAG